jgi:hypothetical protein
MQYALGLLPICFMLYHRIFRLKESTVWQVLPAVWVLLSCRYIPLAPEPSAHGAWEAPDVCKKRWISRREVLRDENEGLL